MSGRRAANRIRGPHSALTDFLAANNISAQQIRDSFQQRVQQAEQANAEASGSRENGPRHDNDDEANADAIANAIAQEEEAAEEAEEAERAIQRSRKRRRASEKEAESSKGKGKGKGKDKKKTAAKKKKHGSDDSDDSDFDVARDMYKKAKPMPGQLANCEICSKRFTVTPYSKAGPDGGLLCTPCGKQQTAETKKADAKAKKPAANKKRRKVESDRLDGLAISGAKSLVQLCIEKVAQHHTDLDEFGDLPPNIINRLSEIFSKKRVMNSKTLQLFLKSEMDTVAIHDCAYLEAEDYAQIFAIVPKLQRLSLRNCCQYKDETMDYMIEKAPNLEHLVLYGANLVSDPLWIKLFQERGNTLRTLKLQWLDAQFSDDVVKEMVLQCPTLERLKLERCRQLSAIAIDYISQLPNLQHVSLQMSKEVPNERLVNLVSCLGSQLETLSLERFVEANDTFLEALKMQAQRLTKFRLTENDYCTDAGFASLFTEWTNCPLKFVDLSSTRDVDNANPNGPEETIGLGSQGFAALMQHSGKSIEYLDIASCRHIPLTSLLEVFDGRKQYPRLKYINVSFCSYADTTVVAGIFKSCPALKKIVAFGCFAIEDVVVPRGIVLIGVPRAQDAIEQYGESWLNVDQALGKMLEIGA